MPRKGEPMSEAQRELRRDPESRWQVPEKRCPRCTHTKPAAAFRRRPNGHLGSYCLLCEREDANERQRRHMLQPEKREINRRNNRKTTLRRYGLTPEGYAELLAAQEGCCAICGTEDPGRGHKNLAIDHDHTTGVVRGLLCHNCNRALGLLGDDIDRVRIALAYLTSQDKR